MLDNSLVIWFNTGSSEFEIRDKYLVNLEYNFGLPDLEIAANLHYDENRQLIWIASTSGKMYRYKLNTDPISVTLEATIDIYGINLNRVGTHMQVFASTGDLFYCYVSNGQYTVCKILVDGDGVYASLNIAKNPGSVYSYQDTASMCINQNTGVIVLIDYYRCSGTHNHTSWGTQNYWYNVTSSNPYRQYAVTTIELDEYRTGNSFYQMVNSMYYQNSEFNEYMSYLTSDNYDSWMQRMDIAYNPINSIIYSSAILHQDRLYYIDTSVFKCCTMGHFYVDERYLLPNRCRLAVGEKSGNLILSDNTHYVVFDINFNIVFEKTWRDFSTSYIQYNRFTEEIYRLNTANNEITIYNRWGEKIKDTSHCVISTIPDLFFILPGAELNTPLDVTPNVIILPKRVSKQSDITPTIIFRVGVSPAGWTQQFRVIADRDPKKISEAKVYDTGFERIADSYSIGDYYKNWKWKYSTDWNEVTGTYNTGTWQSLGVGIGKQSGGTEPDNGVLSTSYGSRFVQFTISDAESLEGAMTEDVWYFKIFTIST